MIHEEFESIFKDAEKGINLKRSFPWGFITETEASSLSEMTELNISSGCPHIVYASDVKHAINRHGVNDKVSSEKFP